MFLLPPSYRGEISPSNSRKPKPHTNPTLKFMEAPDFRLQDLRRLPGCTGQYLLIIRSGFSVWILVKRDLVLEPYQG